MSFCIAKPIGMHIVVQSLEKDAVVCKYNLEAQILAENSKGAMKLE